MLQSAAMKETEGQTVNVQTNGSNAATNAELRDNADPNSSTTGDLETSPSTTTLPLISVIVPVYNVAPYLDDCLQSITDQTYPILEIIVIDDGSTDASGQICDRWTARDPRIM